MNRKLNLFLVIGLLVLSAFLVTAAQDNSQKKQGNNLSISFSSENQGDNKNNTNNLSINPALENQESNLSKNNTQDKTENLDYENETDNGEGQQKKVQLISQNQEQIRAGNYTLANGNKIQVVNQGETSKLRIREVEAILGMNITSENGEGNQTKLKAKLSNGRTAEIKLMPKTASERALERLRLKVCNESNNCTIELKEIGTGNQTNASYEIQLERHSRILGIFQKKMQLKVEVNAEDENSEVKIHKPWWAFLAYEPKEE